MPLIIGEFHFGALDRGLFHPGLVAVANQEARAQAYKDYVLGALAHPQFVGCHWFQYQDEPTTGRGYDEENMPDRVHGRVRYDLSGDRRGMPRGRRKALPALVLTCGNRRPISASKHGRDKTRRYIGLCVPLDRV